MAKLAATGFLALAILAMSAGGGDALTLHVSPDGDDAWSGAPADPSSDGTDGPLATLERARDILRERRDAGTLAGENEVLVLLRGGVHRRAETFRLEPRDSGTAAAPVVFASFPGERAVVSGARPLAVVERDGRWVADVPPLADGSPWNFRQLFVNGRRAVRARAPNDGFFRMAGRFVEDPNDPIANRAFRFAEGDLADWGDPEVEILAIHSWETSRVPIASVDVAAGVVRLAGPAHWPYMQWDPAQRYYVENARHALDAPGEWLLKDGRLEYIPLPGERADEAEVLAPVGLERLVVLDGAPENDLFVEHVRFEGIDFAHTEWTMGPEGISDAQAAHSVPAAIEMRGARRVAIEGCGIGPIGGYVVRVKRGSRHVRIERNHIRDMGAGGVCIGEFGVPSEERDRVGHVLVHNNFVHDGGKVFESAVGVWIGQSSDNTVSHNEICNLGYTGVSVGWLWGYEPTDSHRNLIDANHIHHIGRGPLSDMGGIYTLGDQRGGALRRNHIHHVAGHHYGGWGIYPDEGTSNLLIENNVVHHTGTGGFHQHYGKENVVRNNVFAFSRNAQVMRSRVEEHRSFRFERNVVFYDSGTLFGGKWGDPNVFLDRNVYWRVGGEAPDFDGATLDEWRAKTGCDLESVVADPRFRDPAADDFRLERDSPARALGIESLDASVAGLVGPKKWRELPATVPPQWTEWPE